nr:glutathione ABC transporter substrate-binding protein [Thermus thermophilus]
MVAQGTDPITLDAPLAQDSPSATVVTHISETLFELTPEGRIVPHLAESYAFSDGGRTLTLRLRRGIVFHDGTPFNAEAVKFNLERFVSRELASPFAFLLSELERVEVVDPYTVRLRLKNPFAPILAHLTHSSTAIQSPTAIQRLGAQYRDNPVGTGPYRFQAWQKGQFVDLVRNENYWGEKPSIPQVRFIPVPEGTTRVALVETGQAHVAVRIPPQDIPRLQANPAVEVVRTPSLRTIYIYFNTQRPPFNDVRVRQAFNHAVNKEEILQFVLGGIGRISDAPIAPGIFGYTSVGRYEYNPQRAQELLRQAGVSTPLRITLHCPTGRYFQDIQVCEAIQGQLRRIGVEATIQTLEWGAYLQETQRPLRENRIQMAMLGWGTVTGDADYGLYPLFHSSQWAPRFNRAFYKNVEVDKLLAQARISTLPQGRQQLYREAMIRIFRDAPWLFLHSEVQVTAVRREVQGFLVHPTERYLAYKARFR